MKAALISIEILKDNTILNENLDDSILISGLQSAQDINLQTIIGEGLYNTLQDMVISGEIDSNTKYKNLVIDYIQDFLKYQTLSETIIPLTFKFKSKGVVTNSDNTSGVNPISLKDAQVLVNFYQDRASFFGKRLSDHLNSGTYKEYGSGILKPKSVYNIGIPLNKRR